MAEAPDEELMLAYRGGPAAEELYQEVWMRVIEARSRYDPRGRSGSPPQARFSTWLYTIAHNLMVDHWRRAGLSLVTSTLKIFPGIPRTLRDMRKGVRH